jgi:hypothetical protein
MMEKMKSYWSMSAGGERQGKADHTSRAQEECSSAGGCECLVALERLSNRSRTRSADVGVVKAVQWERRERVRGGE